MTASCPNCKQNLDFEVKVPTVEAPKVEVPHTHTQDPHDELAKIMPKSTNFAKCPNGDCSKGLIKNARGINTKFKTCPNCGNNGVPKGSDYCDKCGLTEEDLEKNDTEWDSSDLNIPTKEEDD